jgi:glycosyltransferase involved in cell wall biosynthesis
MHFAIVSYTFPPSKEIGGRRWAKFSQHLVRMGHEVTVICANDSIDHDLYKKEFPGVQVRVLEKCYPEWLSGFTRSFREKSLYWIYTRMLSPFTKQNFFDRGYAWRRPMLNALENIHLHKPIDVLVVTGAPFSLLYYGAEFKTRHKEIKYVGDLRDPWTWGSYYGMPTLSALKKNFQELSEKKAIEACDMVCYPTQHMGDVLQKKYPSFSSKLYLLPHAFDPDKFPNIIKEEKREGFIYGGSLYPGIEEYIEQLAKIVNANPDSGFKWDIYTGTHYPLIESNFPKGSINMHPLIPEEQLFQKIVSSSAYLAFFPVSDKDLISTKFFEIIYSQTPIVYVGEEGEVSKFIKENRLGVHILPEHMDRDLPTYLNGNVPFESGYFDVMQYTFSVVTEKFLSALKAIETTKDVLLISYVFPPYPGVGGRRWVKFAKYISKKGINVHVICSENPFDEKSVYVDDAQQENIFVYPLKAKYPRVLLGEPSTLFQKIWYKLSVLILKIFTNGSIYDRALFWQEQFKSKTSELIRSKNIRTVIATGAPFRINYYASQLKKEFPNIKIVNDLRDPWTWGVYYGFKTMKDARKTFEENLESETVNNSDIITVPYEPMAIYLKKKYAYAKDKIKVLAHGYDKAEFTEEVGPEAGKKKIIFYGTMYPDQEKWFDALAKAMETCGDVSLDIYASSKTYFKELSGLKSKVIYHAPIKPKLLFSELKKSNAVLIMQPDNAADFISTKINEIVYSGTPIIYIGSKGELWKFITENDLGVCYEPGSLTPSFLAEAFEKIKDLKPDFGVSQFEFDNLTEQLLKMISG